MCNFCCHSCCGCQNSLARALANLFDTGCGCSGNDRNRWNRCCNNNANNCGCAGSQSGSGCSGGDRSTSFSGNTRSGCNGCNHGRNRSCCPCCDCSGCGFEINTNGFNSCGPCYACSDAYYARQYALAYCTTKTQGIFPAFCSLYFAYSTLRNSRMTFTLICPGYSSSASIFLAISLARKSAFASST